MPILNKKATRSLILDLSPKGPDGKPTLKRITKEFYLVLERKIRNTVVLAISRNGRRKTITGGELG